jgi:hypothetical protein
MDDARYSVRCGYDDGSHNYVREDATVDEAVEAFGFYVHCFSARIGTLQRVTVLSGDGMVSQLEWIFGKGITRKPVVGTKVDAGVSASQQL